jgi:hypothetical protein
MTGTYRRSGRSSVLPILAVDVAVMVYRRIARRVRRVDHTDNPEGRVVLASDDSSS